MYALRSTTVRSVDGGCRRVKEIADTPFLGKGRGPQPWDVVLWIVLAAADDQRGKGPSRAHPAHDSFISKQKLKPEYLFACHEGHDTINARGKFNGGKMPRERESISRRVPMKYQPEGGRTA